MIDVSCLTKCNIVWTCYQEADEELWPPTQPILFCTWNLEDHSGKVWYEQRLLVPQVGSLDDAPPHHCEKVVRGPKVEEYCRHEATQEMLDSDMAMKID
ncbi:hypothetical protein RND71_042800 [Anisodus tanguticus]|uniref:Uncharacterized protein n=1 Tax=Anisodus tanguticus TaxID=243964 RepID=A0AAE1QT06_9SOLA|nr:hypothetical protein RND71_042800 [Anisodus tanguticus]